MDGFLWPALLSLLFYGLWGFFPKLAVGHLDPRSALLYQLSGTAVVVLLGLLLGPTLQFNARGAAGAALMGVSGALGSLFMFLALGRGRASVVVTLTALYPLVTLLLAFLILKEPITLKQGLGMLLALAAMALLAQ